MEVAEIVIDLIRIATPGARMQAVTATRPPRPLRSRNDWVPKDPNHPFNQLVDVLMAKEAAAKPPDLN